MNFTSIAPGDAEGPVPPGTPPIPPVPPADPEG